MNLPELAALLGLNLALLVVAMLVPLGLAVRLKDVGFADAVWPLGLLFLALVAFARTDGDGTRKFLLLWLCAVWAIRSAWHLLARWRRGAAGGAYAALVREQGEAGWSLGRTALVFVFLPQAILIWIIALPVQLGPVSAVPSVGWLGWTGALVVVVGIAFENIADAQHSAFRKASPDRDGEPTDGLWRFTRHPRYFGDACVWWGLWLIAAETGWIGVASVIGPLLMTFILRRWSGLGGASAAGDLRLGAFAPWPPRKT